MGLIAKSLVLLVQPVLDLLLKSLLAMDGLQLHAPLLLLQFVLQVPLFLHDLIIVPLLCDSLLVSKLLLHLILDLPQAVLILEAHLLFKEVSLLCILLLQFAFLVLEHLCESLFDQRFVISEFFLSFFVHLGVLAGWTHESLLLLLALAIGGRSRPMVLRVGLLLKSMTGAAATDVPVAVHSCPRVQPVRDRELQPGGRSV